MSGNKRFAVAIQEIQILPIRSMKPGQNRKGRKKNSIEDFQCMDEAARHYVHFDMAGYRQVLTAPKTFPWVWKATDSLSFIYMTHHSHDFANKSLNIFCKLKHRWTSDEILAQAEIDLETLVTGPSSYTLIMYHPTEKYPVCKLKFVAKVD